MPSKRSDLAMEIARATQRRSANPTTQNLSPATTSLQRRPPGPHDTLLALQRSAGNQAVEALLRSSRTAPPPVLQRCGGHACPPGGRDQDDRTIQRQSTGIGPAALPPSVTGVLSSPGSPLAPQVLPQRNAGTPMVQASSARLMARADSAGDRSADRAADAVANHSAPDPADLRGPSGLRPAPVLPSVAARIERLGPGRTVAEDDRRDLGRRFGFDFSSVRIHADDRAGDLAALVGARAFTVGSDVVFGRGRYAPHDRQGSRLLSHELAHVVQQRRSGVPVLQMTAISDFLKTDPSQVTDAQLDSTDEFKAYMAMNPKPPAKQVVSPVEARLALRLLLRNLNELPPGTVFAPHDLDGWLRTARARSKVAATAEATVGQGAWVPLSPVDVRGPKASSSDFMRWMLGGGKVPAVLTAKGNCWEMVMFSAYRAGHLAEARMRDIYTKGQAEDKARGGLAFPEVVEAELRASKEHIYDPAKAGSPRPLRGDIVIFDTAAGHVALATGRTVGGQIEIISHWGPPHNNPRVETTTIEDLLMSTSGPVRFWSPRW
jgi:hypothetical protein